MTNQQIAQLLDAYGMLLEMDGDEGWRSGTVYRAAETIRQLSQPIENIDPASLSGIGESTASKIREAIKTGTFSALERLKLNYPISILELTKVHGIGVKRAVKLWKDKGIQNLAQLRNACETGIITDSDMLARVEFAMRPFERIPRGWILQAVAPILDDLRRIGWQCELAGSIRRKCETCKDADLLIRKDFDSTARLIAEHIKLNVLGTATLGPSDEIKARLFIDVGEFPLQLDILLVEPNNWGAALNYFTGSREHNILLRRMAMEKGWKINEYGIFDERGRRLGGKKESDLYSLLEIPYVPPELREGHELVKEPTNWIEAKHIRYDFHVHSKWSDGKSTIAEIANEVYQKKLLGVAICDHSYMIRNKVDEYLEAIRTYSQQECEDYEYRLLAGVEVDIAKDGTLDLDDQELSKFDLVIAAIHRQHDQNVEERLIAAASHPNVHIIAHPTGRQFGNRPIPDINWGRVFEICIKYNVALEINAQPDRIDLPELLVKRAKDAGCKFVITSDAHHASGIGNISLGVEVARRAELEKTNVYYDVRTLKSLKKKSKENP